MTWKSTALIFATAALFEACGANMHQGKIVKSSSAGKMVLTSCGDLTEGGTPSQTPPAPRQAQMPPNQVPQPQAPSKRCLSMQKVSACLKKKGLVAVTTFNLDLGTPGLEGANFKSTNDDLTKAKYLLKDTPNLILNEYMDMSDNGTGPIDDRIGAVLNAAQTGCAQVALGNQTYTIDPSSTQYTLNISTDSKDAPIRKIYYTLSGQLLRVTYFTQEDVASCSGKTEKSTLRQSYELNMGPPLPQIPIHEDFAKFLSGHVSVSPDFISALPRPDGKQKDIRVRSAELQMSASAYFHAIEQIDRGKVSGVDCQTKPAEGK